MTYIPQGVFDALKEGNTHKNYRILVHAESEDEFEQEEIGSFFGETLFPIEETGVYTLVCYTENAFNYVTTYDKAVGIGGELESLPVTETSPYTTCTYSFSDNELIGVAGLPVTTEVKVFKQVQKKIIDVIDNNKLVYESVRLDERLCSGDELKFGLCEGASLEFEYFDYKNIRGLEVDAYLDVDYINQQRDAITLFANSSYDVEHDGFYDISYFGSSTGRIVVKRNGVTIEDIQLGNGIMYQLDLLAGDIMYSQINDDVTIIPPAISAPATHAISLGTFTVDKCARQYTTGIYKVTAYNKLKSKYLDAKANSIISDLPSDTYNNNLLSVYAIKQHLLNRYKFEEMGGTSLIGNISSGYTSPILTDVTIKKNGSSTAYTAQIDYQCVYYEIPQNKRAVIENLGIYRAKHRALMLKLFNEIHQNCQNPEQTIENLKKNVYFQALCGISVSFYDYNESMTNPHYEISNNSVNKFSDAVNHGGVITNVYYSETLPTAQNQIKVRETFDDTIYLTNAKAICFGYITGLSLYKSGSPTIDIYHINGNRDYNDMEVTYYDLADSEKISINRNIEQDVTLRDLMSAEYELKCRYGQINKGNGLFVERYLGGTNGLVVDKSAYSALWLDEQEPQRFKYLIVTYKGLDGDGNEREYTLQRTVNADGNVNYNMSTNWLLNNLVWTAEQVGAFADAMVEEMRDISWLPFELWNTGMPHLDVGDKIFFDFNGGVQSSYILTRQLKGIQNLQDTFTNGEVNVF